MFAVEAMRDAKGQPASQSSEKKVTAEQGDVGDDLVVRAEGGAVSDAVVEELHLEALGGEEAEKGHEGERKGRGGELPAVSRETLW